MESETHADGELLVKQLLAMVIKRGEEQAKRHDEEIKLFQDQLEKKDEQMRTLFEKFVNQKSESKESLFDRLRQRIEKFSFDPEEGRFFSLWFRRFEDTVKSYEGQLPDESKTELLRTLLDGNTYAIFSTRISPRSPNNISWEETITILEQLFGPKKSLFRRRFDFSHIVCAPGSDFSTYGNKIIAAAETAELRAMTDEAYKCVQYVSGLQAQEYVEIRSRLLRMLDSEKDNNNPITVLELIAESERIKMSLDDIKTIEGPQLEIQAINRSNSPYRRPMSPRHTLEPPSQCPICGGPHWKRECPKARHTNSPDFGKSRKFVSRDHPSWRQEYSTNRGRSSSRQHKFIGCIDSDNEIKQYIEVTINDKPIQLRLDTGAEVTLISRPTWISIGRPHLTAASANLSAANGQPLSTNGKFHTNFAVKNKSGNIFHGRGVVYVTESNDLMGMPWINQLPDFKELFENYAIMEIRAFNTNAERIAITERLKHKYADVFKPELGLCTKISASLQLKPDAQPVFKKKRPVPHAAFEQLNNEISRLQKEGIISPVDHSQWAAPIVAVRKANGSIRLCADFSTGLNDSLMLHRHPLPTMDDVFTKLNGGTVFSQVDFAEAYHQVEVAENCKELLTINTHKGLFRYNRLPFGVKSAPGIFQQIIDTMISGLDGVAAYLDDVIVTGRTLEEHNANLEALFDRIVKYGFRIRIEKCNLLMTEITYLGNVISAAGRRPDPKKIDAIILMPPPKDVGQVRTFLGLISYYSSFVPRMRNLRAPLDALLKKDTAFQWSHSCQSAFDETKKILLSDLLLTHYDPHQPIVVAADASEYGIGAVISHKYKDGTEKAIAHASRALTPAEKKYGQIEKEGLALVFAVRKFHRYIYGRHFTLLTDHQPLLAIFGNKKGIPPYTANRLQRWALTLLAYDFKIEYCRTTSFGQADTLSRLIGPHKEPEEDTLIATINQDVNSLYINAVKQLPVSNKEICDATKTDNQLKTLLQYVKTGKWNEGIAPTTNKLGLLKHEITIHENCLFFGSRIIIPQTLQKRVLGMLHKGHPGITRMKIIAREHVYWSGIDRDIENWTRSCSSCQQAAKSPIKHTLCSWPQETKPWSRIHIDYAGPLHGKMYLVVVDAFSKWPEIIEMTNSTTSSTINALQRIFAQFGLPETIVSDNGTQFTSTIFQEYCTENTIKHVKSPPFHPQSNGQAERFVDTFKRALIKLRDEGTSKQSLQTFLFSYRITPCASSPGGRSPAENFIGRQLRSVLDGLKPHNNKSNIQTNNMEKQFNRHHGARPRHLQPGDLVFVRDYRAGPTNWTPGRVLRRKGRVLYDIAVHGKTWSRHVNQLRQRIGTGITNTLLETFDLPYKTNPTSTVTNDIVLEHQETDTKEVGIRRSALKSTTSPDIKKSVRFQLPTETPVENTSPVEPCIQDTNTEATSSLTLERPKRTLRPPSRLTLDPRKKSYTYQCPT